MMVLVFPAPEDAEKRATTQPARRLALPFAEKNR